MRRGPVDDPDLIHEEQGSVTRGQWDVLGSCPKSVATLPQLTFVHQIDDHQKAAILDNSSWHLSFAQPWGGRLECIARGLRAFSQRVLRDSAETEGAPWQLSFYEGSQESAFRDQTEKLKTFCMIRLTATVFWRW